MSINDLYLNKLQLELLSKDLGSKEIIGSPEDTNSIFTKTTDSIAKDSSFSSNSIFDELDKDGDGKISDKELYDFTSLNNNKKNGIKEDLNSLYQNLDENSDNTLSAKELDKMEDSSDGLGKDLLKKLMVMAGFNIDEEAKAPIQEEIDKLEEKYGTEKPTEDDKINQPNATQGSHGVGSSGGSGGGGNSFNSTETADSGNPKTKEEFKQEIQNKENEKKAAETEAKNDIKSQEDAIQEAMEDAESGLTPSQVQKYNQEKEKIDTDIQTQQSTIDGKTTEIQDKTARRDAINSTLAAYDNQIASLKSVLAACSDDKEGKDKKASIQKKINKVETERNKKKDEQDRLGTDIQTAKADLEIAKEEKTRLEKEKDSLLDKFLEENKHKMPPEIQAKIKEAQSEIRDIRNAEKTKTEAIDNELQTLKTGLAEVEEKEESDKIINANSECLYDENGKRIGPRKMPTTIEEFAKYGLTGDEIEKFKMCNKEAQAAILDLLDCAIRDGHEVNISSSFRTVAEQARISNGGKNEMAAAPGKSQHNKGLAFDITLNGSNKNKNLKKYGEIWKSWGLTWGGDWKNQYEPWHFDCRGVFEEVKVI